MKYKIKQITKEAKAKKSIDYWFMDYDWAEEHGFNIEDYIIVYEGETDETDAHKALEGLFMNFNINRPADFKGHSLSVSDVVELDGKNYYCDSCGWKELEA